MTYSESSVKKRKKINLKLIRKLSKSISNNEHRAIILLFLETRISPKKLVKLRFEDFEFTTCTIKINEKRGLELCKLLIDKIDDPELTEELIEYFDNRQVSLEYGKLTLIKKIYKEINDKIYIREQNGK